MLYNMLTNSSTGGQSGSGGLVMVLLFVVVIVVFMVFNSRSQKKSWKERMDMLDALKPGTKVMTRGGICGIIVEVCPDDNTFVLETGTEASGKSYIKFNKEAVYQSDAVAEKAPVVEELETPVEETAEEVEAVEESTEKSE